MILCAVIDSREPKYIQAIQFPCSVETSVKFLETGDAKLFCDDGRILLVERKEASDFLGSMCSNRLMEQARRLAECREDSGVWPYVMICGGLYPTKNGTTSCNGKIHDIEFSSVVGELLNIQELGVFVAFCRGDRPGDASEYANALWILSNRNRSSVHICPPPKRRGETLTDAAGFLAGLPGVGSKTADELIDFCETPWKFIQMLRCGDYLPGIGKKKRAQLLEIIGIEKEN